MNASTHSQQSLTQAPSLKNQLAKINTFTPYTISNSLPDFQMSAATFTVSPVPQEANPSYSILDQNHPVPDLSFGPIDLNNLTRAQRIGLVQGPTAGIYLNGKYIGFVNIRAAMALSPFAHHFFTQYPNHGMNFSAAAVNEKALRIVLRYFSFHLLGGKTVRRLPFGKNFIESVRIYRAAVVFGLQEYISHLVGYLHGYIKRDDSLLSYDGFDALLWGTTPEDRIFRHAASLYSRLRYVDEIPDREEFNDWVGARPVIAEAMAAIDERHACERAFYDEKRAGKIAWQERKREREARAKAEEEKIKEGRIKAEERKAEKARKKAKEHRPAPGLTRSSEAEERSNAFWAKYN